MASSSSIITAGIAPGLSRVVSLLSYFPPLSIPVIHIAGTNGKGSVSAILDSCLTAAGIKTGRFNSPHLVEVNDSIRLSLQPIDRSVYDEVKKEVEGVNEKEGCKASLFEILVVVALQIFHSHKPEVIILECGMGGVEDATNVFPPALVLLSVLTSVDLDHQAFLGNTVEEISKAKAGITRQGGLICVGRQNKWESQVYGVVNEIAKARSAKVFYTPLASPLDPPQNLLNVFRIPGDHQKDNLALALTCLSVLRTEAHPLSVLPRLLNLTDEAILKGVSNAVWEGRCSWIDYPTSLSSSVKILLDGAHNPASSLLLRNYIDSLSTLPSRRTTFILSLSHSPPKTPRQVLSPLLRAGDRVAIVEFNTPVEGMPWIRAVDAPTLQSAAKELVGEAGEVWVSEKGAEEAVKWSLRGREENELVVVCGSLYLVGDFYRLLKRLSE